MIGCTKAISPCVKSASAKLFLDLHTVLAPSGEERTLGAGDGREVAVTGQPSAVCQPLLHCST
eukprot:scaffold31748_cov48-Phaeocystis_antarctica.AAC.1